MCCSKQAVLQQLCLASERSYCPSVIHVKLLITISLVNGVVSGRVWDLTSLCIVMIKKGGLDVVGWICMVLGSKETP